MTAQRPRIGPFVADADARRYRAAGFWSATETLPLLLAAHAQRVPDRLAVVDDQDRSLTYAQLHASATALAAAMSVRGVRGGDVVGVQLPNRVEAAVAAAAAERLGAIVCPLVPPYRHSELAHIIGKTSMAILFIPGTYRGFDYEAMAGTLQRDQPSLKTVVTLAPKSGSRAIPYRDLVAAGEGVACAEPDGDPDAVCAILFTSGTESAPKAVAHTHNTLLANVRALIRRLSLTEADGVFMASPVGHGTGYGFGIRLAAYLGSTLSLLSAWEPRRAAEMLQRYGAAYTHGSTPFVQDLAALPDVTDYDFSALRYFVTGGAAIPPGTASRVAATLGCRLLRLYGQTEGFMTTLSLTTDDLAETEQTDGVPIEGVEVRCVDENGVPVNAGTPGECQYRGPHRCVGFLHDRARESAALTDDGWFRSGDLVTIREDGRVTVVGRKKDVINRGGYKYSPQEIEDVLSTHPDVIRIAIVRQDDPRLGERACAFVVTANPQITLEALTAHLNAKGIATFKWPERLEVVPEFPMTASGKVQKFQLEQRLRSGPAVTADSDQDVGSAS
jgi:non-ribosomal peptide synthetase component E (peptide arylation enzyme)